MTRAQLIAELNARVISGGSDTTAAGLRAYENEIISSLLNVTDDLNVNGGYLGISSNRVDVSFINSSTPSGLFLRDDGTWAAAAGGSSDLASVLAVGNVTGGTPLLVTSGDYIDSDSIGGTLDIGSTNQSVINIGRSGCTVNILGTALYEYAANQYVLDKLITLNYNGAAASGGGTGFEIEEGGAISGYFKTSAARTGFLMKGPASFEATLRLNLLTGNHIYVYPDVDGTHITTGNLSSITSTGTLAGLSVAANGTVLGVDSLNSNGPKIILKEAGVVQSYLGCESGYIFTAYSSGGALLFGVPTTGIVATTYTAAKIKGAIAATAGLIPIATGTADTVTTNTSFFFDGTTFKVGSTSVVKAAQQEISGQLNLNVALGGTFLSLSDSGSSAYRGLINLAVTTADLQFFRATGTNGAESFSETIRITNTNGDVGIGTGATVSARLHLIKTTEQLRVGYDASNYYSTTVGSTGLVTFNAVGSGSQFLFTDNINVGTGIAADGGGMKHSRTTTGSVAAGATALVTITWGSAFPDTNYTVCASVIETTTAVASMIIVHIESKSTSAVTVRVVNNHATNALTGTIQAIAIHD